MGRRGQTTIAGEKSNKPCGRQERYHGRKTLPMPTTGPRLQEFFTPLYLVGLSSYFIVCILIISSWCCIHSVRRRPYLHIKDSTAYKNRALASSLYTPAIKAVQKEFDVSAVIAIFPFSFYVLGLAFGPMIGSPLSETLGRRRVYQISLPVFALFILGSGFAKGIGTLVVCRFLAGLWGSPALSIGSATVSDVWPPAHRAIPMAAYVAAPFMGPALG